MASVQTFKISDLDPTTLDTDNDSLEVSRDNGDGTFDSFKVPASDFGGGGVEVGQTLLQIAAQPLGADQLRLDGSYHPVSSYPAIESFFEAKKDVSNVTEDTGVPTVSARTNLVELSADGSKLYFSSDSSGTVDVYDTSDYSLIKSIDPFPGQTPTVFRPASSKRSRSGDIIAFAIDTDQSVTDEIFLLDTRTDTIFKYLPSSAANYYLNYFHSVSFSRDDRLIAYRTNSYPSNRSNQYNIYDMDRGVVVDTITNQSSDGYLWFVEFDTLTDKVFICHRGGGFDRFEFNFPKDLTFSVNFHAISGSNGLVSQPSEVAFTYDGRPFVGSSSSSSPDIFGLSRAQVESLEFDNNVNSPLTVSSPVACYGLRLTSDDEYILTGLLNTSPVFYSTTDLSIGSTVSGVVDSQYGVGISSDDSKFVFGLNSTDNVRVFTSANDGVNFVLPDLASPDPAFEYRIKAQ